MSVAVDNFRDVAVEQRSAAFRAARRHTLIVKALRVALPALGIFGLAAYGVLLAPKISIGNGTFMPGSITITADDLKMRNPSYFGKSKDDGRYVVRAQQAAVGLKLSGPIALDGIDGEFTQASGETVRLRATRGTFHREKNEMELLDGIALVSSSGMSADLRTAHVFAKEHRIVSTEPLQAKVPAGTLRANQMELWTEKRQGVFHGDVALRLTPPASERGAAPSVLSVGGSSDAPVDVWAQTLTIDDMAGTATLSGGVTAQQGETVMQAPEINIVYETPSEAKSSGERPAIPAVAPGGSAVQSQLKRLEARGGMRLTAGPGRRILAERADFDAVADKAVLTGSVEVAQDRNIMRGSRLTIDRNGGTARLDNDLADRRARGAGRISATFVEQQSATPRSAQQRAEPASDNRFGVLGSFRSEPDAPIDVEASVLTINDASRQAVFRGEVVARRGGVTIEAPELTAHYTGRLLLQSEGGQTSGQPGVRSEMTRVDTRGGTVIRSSDGQTATAETASFDVRNDVVVMQGKDGVILQQGPNLTRGTRLRIDLKTGEARLEFDRSSPTIAAQPATPAQQSILARPGVAPPQQPDADACRTSTGQPCAVLYPQQLKQLNEQAAQQRRAPGSTSPEQGRPSARGWQPSTSPSEVYRSN